MPWINGIAKHRIKPPSWVLKEIANGKPLSPKIFTWNDLLVLYQPGSICLERNKQMRIFYPETPPNQKHKTPANGWFLSQTLNRLDQPSASCQIVKVWSKVQGFRIYLLYIYIMHTCVNIKNKTSPAELFRWCPSLCVSSDWSLLRSQDFWCNLVRPMGLA